MTDKEILDAIEKIEGEINLSFPQFDLKTAIRAYALFLETDLATAEEAVSIQRGIVDGDIETE